MYPFFDIFGRTVGSYAVCCFIGIFISVAVATRLGKNFKITFEDMILLMVTLSFGILIGGSSVYALTNLEKIIKYTGIAVEKIASSTLTFSHIKYIISECFGGMVFYGGFIGATLALKIYIKFSKIHDRHILSDIFAISVPLFHTFGRIGCFLGGCCYGVESSYGFIAQNELLPEMSGIRRFPVALVESVLNFLIFLMLLYLFRKEKKRGRMLFVYMITYPPIRFCLEFFRGDEIRGIFFGLSTSQWISIVIFAVGVMGLYKKNSSYVTKS